MAEVLGAMDILNKALPTGVDGTRIAQWELRAGRTWGDFLGETALALAELNDDLMNRWDWLFFITEEQMFEYMTGGSVTASPMITDLDFPDPSHAQTIAHMIDLIPYGETVGGTKYFFRDGREATYRAAIRSKVDRLTWRFEQTLLNRLFVPTETSVGTSGYNVGFAYGTTGNVDFVPPAYGGEAFGSTHSHYIGVDTDSYGYDDALNQLAEHLEEHGHPAPFVAVVSRTDISSYYALPDFVEPLDNRVVIVDRGTTTADTGAALFSRETREMGVIGGFQSEYGYIELRATNRVPTATLGMVKSYGRNNERNPIAIRVHPNVGFGARITAQSNADDLDRIKRLLIEFEFGIGVGMDRTNGIAAYLSAAGTFTAPTIS
jgi:hypothetical protein